jgi:hypothetical protein
MIDAEAIRAAFAAIADETVSPERVRATLAARARRHRQRRIVLRTAGAGAAAAIAGTVGLDVWRRSGSVQDGFPQLAGGPGGGWLEVPLRYRPTWLPTGYGQAGIDLIVADQQAAAVARTWQPAGPPGSGLTPSVRLTVGWHDRLPQPRGRADNVAVNGVDGEVVQSDSTEALTSVRWQPPGQPPLMVTVLREGEPDRRRDDALRVARSLRSTTGRVWVGPRFGWLPPEFAAVPWTFVVGFDSAWQESVAVYTEERALVVCIGPEAHKGLFDRAAAEPIRVRGLDGWKNQPNGQLFVTLPDGIEVFLQFDPGAPQGSSSPDAPRADPIPDLVRIVEAFDFGPWPDMSWVGTR